MFQHLVKSGCQLLLMVTLLSSFPLSLSAQEDTPKSDEPQATEPANDAQEEEEPTLGIGSDAPVLDIEYWISDDDGFYLHTEEFDEGFVYVIDFWSFRWPPTVLMLPRMVELQKKFKNDDVQIISISQDALDRVEQFLDRELPDNPKMKDAPKSFRELTEPFCLTCDPDNSVFKDYFQAANRTQLPTSFIVGKDGKIEWIGHPIEMEEPLKKIIDDKWDRDAFAKTYKAEMDKQKLVARIAGEIPRGQGEAAILKYIEGQLAKEEFKPIEYELSMTRMQLLIKLEDEKAASALRAFADKFTKDEETATALNNMIWEYYELYEAGQDVDEEILKACLYAARVAIKFAPNSGAVNDTVAHFVYVVENNLDEAIEWQKKAVANAEGREADLQPFLDKLLKEKKEGKKSSGEKPKPKKKTDF